MTVPPRVGFETTDVDAATLAQLVEQVAESNEFMLRGNVARWEDGLRRAVRATAAVGCGSHAGAWTLAARAADVRPGDRVVVPALAPRALVVALARLGAQAAPVEVDERTGAPVEAAVVTALRQPARAVATSHPLGVAGDQAPLAAIAAAHGVPLLEDASETQCALLADGRWALARATVLDTGPGRPLGGVGEAAAVLTDDAEIERRCRWLRNHGQDGLHRFLHHHVGYNCRLDEVCAGYLARRLDRLDHQARRATLARRYTARLAGLADRGLRTPPVMDGVPDRYVVLVPNREGLIDALVASGVQARSLDLVKIGPPDDGAADSLLRRHLALPLHPGLDEDQVDYVCATVERHYG